MFQQKQDKEYAIFNRADMYYRNIFEKIYIDIQQATMQDDIYQYYTGIKSLYMYVQPFLKDDKAENQIREALSESNKNIIKLRIFNKQIKNTGMVEEHYKKRGEVKVKLDGAFLKIWQLMHKKNMLLHMGQTDNRPSVLKEKYT